MVMVEEQSNRLGGKGAQTRRAILDAAIDRFGRDGYKATSVADIARDASVGGSVTYTYFPNKEALFLAALDEDAAAVLHDGLATLTGVPRRTEWRETLVYTLLAAVEEHPLARRVLAGREPEVIDRVLEIPALADLRKLCAERIRTEQAEGTIRTDIDATTIANGLVSIILSLMMSVVLLGNTTAATYGDDITAVFQAALDAPASGNQSAPTND